MKLHQITKPFQEGLLKVSDLHQIYYWVSGNENGIPLLIPHGGPGSHSKPDHRAFYNPEKYKIIQFDQRGAGKSVPKGEVNENETQDLINDMESLRKFLNIEKWIISGGSWGSTLALIYAIQFPENVSALILRGIFLSRKEDYEWFGKFGANQLYPDIWEPYAAYLEKNNISPENSSEFLYKKLNGSKEEQIEAAAIVASYEGNMLKLINEFEFVKPEQITEDEIAESRIFMHYEKNNSFLEDNYILKNASKINSIPTVIIHGRYDVICPLRQAWLLHKELPNAEFNIIPDAGHHSSEAGITKAIIEAAKKFETLD